ncbi:MAG: DUF3352 domain-containing protein [Pontiellaceae bacterium]|nr:DUF3352 domain-containing protein [Pontiellaceae bacterium]
MSMLSLMLVLLLGGSVPQQTTAEAAKPVQTVQTEQPVRAELTQLDLDGNFLLFMDTSSMKARINQTIDTVADMAKMEVPEGQVDSIVGMVKKGLDDTGLLSVDSYALSMKPLENGLTRTISVLDYGAEDADTILWRVLASEPRELKGIQYVPADAVLVENSTAGLNEIWKIFEEVTSDYLPPEQQAMLNEQIGMVEMMIGAELSELFGSLDNEILVSVQLSEGRKCVLPIEDDVTLTLSEPSAIIGLQTKNPMISALILQQLKQAEAPLTETEMDGFTLHTIYLPMPLPLSFAPTLVQTDDYLLIGTNPETIAKALESYKQKNGLISVPEYRKLLADAPAKVSAVSYLSPRFMEEYKAAMTQLVENIDEEELSTLFNMMFSNMRPMQGGKYVLKTPTGIYSKSYSNIATNPGELIASSVAANVGVLAAIGIPSYQKARTTSIEKVCENNRRIIQSAKQQLAIENSLKEDAQLSEADLSPYIRGGFDAVQCPLGGTIEINPIGEEPSCSIHGTLY